MTQHLDQYIWDRVHSMVWYQLHDTVRIPVYDRIWAVYDEIYDSLGEDDA
jgi:hypothetical protein